MARVKGGNVARKRRKKVLKLAKGYFGSKHTLYKTAHEQVMNSLMYAYRDRRKRKSDFRKLWISRINAAARMHEMSYSQFMNGLKKSNIFLNRKVLADLAITDPEAFGRLVASAKAGIANPQAAFVEESSKPAPKAPAQKETPAKETKPAQETKPVKEAPAAQATEDLEAMTVADLKALAKAKNLEGYSALKKAELIDLLKKQGA